MSYLGYLCGALIASLICDLVVALITTAGMGLTDNVWLWSGLRFFAGLSCAAGMLLGTGLILN